MRWSLIVADVTVKAEEVHYFFPLLKNHTVPKNSVYRDSPVHDVLSGLLSNLEGLLLAVQITQFKLATFLFLY